jgi:C4-dicarboxylate-specific signal transduction histidine kinase
LQDIAADAQRAAQVIRRLRALLKKEHGERHAVDMTAVIKEVVSLLGKDLERRRICLELALPLDTPHVLGDVVQLQQVILNVLLNAAEAMTDEAHPRVLRIETNARESGILTITARDSGRGPRPRAGAHLRALRHEQGGRARDGIVDKPLDRQGARRTDVGDAEHGTRVDHAHRAAEPEGGCAPVR